MVLRIRKSLGSCTLKDNQDSENSLDTEYYKYLLTGGTGLPGKTPDERIQNVFKLPGGPFQLTSSTFPYDPCAASPVPLLADVAAGRLQHSIRQRSGIQADAKQTFTWVEVTIRAGSNGKPQKSDFNDQSTGEGSTAMGFYNVLQSDAPYLRFLADHYSMSDNYHQPVIDGTGANSLMLGFADAIWFSDANGNPAKPSHRF